MNNPVLFRIVAIIWTIIIFLGCSVPGPDIPPVLTLWHDKLMHIAIFVPFGLLWVLAGYRALPVLLAGILYGGFIEICQGILPINRSADVQDAIADTVGALIGVALGLVWQRLFHKQRL
ncbi:VanZ family protein [Fibrisoma limi BUZ 3]|uniref:VanZ family protein n=2 Tax=Fibrisoma limi TaxID=663275 RepID=I2GTQ2_9BACT|nr:VanZ family protein [Fibrisoma limi BUZ 3]